MIRADARFGPSSRDALDLALARGSLVACEVVWGEVIALFHEPAEGRHTLEKVGVRFSAITVESAERAGSSWRAYRRAGGPRERLIADFLVAAHAVEQADVLLTRDRGFTRRHFGELRVEDPSPTWEA